EALIGGQANLGVRRLCGRLRSGAADGHRGKPGHAPRQPCATQAGHERLLALPLSHFKLAVVAAPLIDHSTVGTSLATVRQWSAARPWLFPPPRFHPPLPHPHPPHSP